MSTLYSRTFTFTRRGTVDSVARNGVYWEAILTLPSTLGPQSITAVTFDPFTADTLLRAMTLRARVVADLVHSPSGWTMTGVDLDSDSVKGAASGARTGSREVVIAPPWPHRLVGGAYRSLALTARSLGRRLLRFSERPLMPDWVVQVVLFVVAVYTAACAVLVYLLS